MKPPRSFEGRLVWLFLGYWVLSIFTYVVSGRFEHFFFGINLSLALVPLLLANILRKGVKRSWVWWMIALAIVAFFPNAFYLFTDFIHLGGTVFFGREHPYAPLVYRREWIDWLRVVHIGLGAILGAVGGVSAYARSKQALLEKAPKGAKYMPLMLLLSSVGIYIGRFLRFNSWDLLFRPWSVLSSIWNDLDGFAVLFVLFFFALQWSVLWLLSPLFERVIKEESS